MSDQPATPVSDPEPDKSNEVDHALWVARHQAADTPVDPTTHEGRLSRLVHAWRRHQEAPLVQQPLIAEQLDAIVAEHEESGVKPEDDAKVAAKAQLLKVETDAREARAAEDPLPDEPFGHVPEGEQPPDPVLDVPAEPEPIPTVETPVTPTTIETVLVAAEEAARKAEADLAAARAAANPPATPAS